ncbi:hypothetical protein E0H86_09930 [Acinetobacter sp. ANC 4635]|uniref:hypothetical protein n=1 Tax=Acinetobacter sp. ANC 4635 TaxID=2529846 RepID=UPI00103DCFE1|nr:hypothetical protein [Acinetobacter sp. ANC 4635]TCB30081.1 hypothetical protein E0H86_09930 [Acinetobacter sp. ANC 4635]
MCNLELELRKVKNFVEINYDADEVASQCMRIYNHFSSEFSGRSHNEIMRLIAMDMGEEFDLGKDETLKVLEFLIDQNRVL